MHGSKSLNDKCSYSMFVLHLVYLIKPVLTIPQQTKFEQMGISGNHHILDWLICIKKVWRENCFNNLCQIADVLSIHIMQLGMQAAKLCTFGHSLTSIAIYEVLWLSSVTFVKTMLDLNSKPCQPFSFIFYAVCFIKKIIFCY